MNVLMDYECEGCGAEGIKLWRAYQTFNPDLFCCDCTAARTDDSEFADITDIHEDGTIPHPSEGLAAMGQRTVCLGWYVPAVPVDNNDTFWGYVSCPSDAYAWWQALPLREAA